MAFITKYLAYGTRVTNAAMLQLHPEPEEVAQMSGASWRQTFTRIIVPLLAPAFINGWLFVAVHSMRDLLFKSNNKPTPHFQVDSCMHLLYSVPRTQLII